MQPTRLSRRVERFWGRIIDNFMLWLPVSHVPFLTSNAVLGAGGSCDEPVERSARDITVSRICRTCLECNNFRKLEFY